MSALTAEIMDDARIGGRLAVRTCDACSAEVVVRASEEAWWPQGRWGVVWFCEACLAGLPAAEIGRLSREVALRGVPLS